MEGCICLEDYVNVSGYKLKPKSKMQERKGYCSCFLSNDIGAVFNSCLHLCKYCYSNGKIETVINNFKKHDDNSPFLIG